MEDIESIYRRWIDELWNKRNVDIVDELFDKQGVSHYPNFVAGDPAIVGREALKKLFFLAAEKTTFIGAEIEEITSSGNKVVALCRVRVKLRDVSSDDPESHLEMDVKCLCDIKFKDGMIIEHWNNVQFVNKDERLEIIEFHA